MEFDQLWTGSLMGFRSSGCHLGQDTKRTNMVASLPLIIFVILCAMRQRSKMTTLHTLHQLWDSMGHMWPGVIIVGEFCSVIIALRSKDRCCFFYIQAADNVLTCKVKVPLTCTPTLHSMSSFTADGLLQSYLANSVK